MIGRVERIGLDVDPVDDSLPFDHVDDPADNHRFPNIILRRLQKTGKTNRSVRLPDLVGGKGGRPGTARKDQKGEKEIKFSSLEKCSDHGFLVGDSGGIIPIRLSLWGIVFADFHQTSFFILSSDFPIVLCPWTCLDLLFIM
jgi:hypothetical protein